MASAPTWFLLLPHPVSCSGALPPSPVSATKGHEQSMGRAIRALCPTRPGPGSDVKIPVTPTVSVVFSCLRSMRWHLGFDGYILFPWPSSGP